MHSSAFSPPLRNIRLTIAYDGSAFWGWQYVAIQFETINPSVEGTLQAVLRQLLGTDVLLNAASRTDRGVHARGQVVNFCTHALLDIKKLHHGLNALLPPALRVIQITEMALSFHATLDSIGKIYGYQIDLGAMQMPHRRHTAWHFPYAIDKDALKEALHHFVGTHDFASFANSSDKELTTSLCEIFSIDCIETQEGLYFRLHGKRFLYKMVRNIVGTILWVARGKIASSSLPSFFTKPSRTETGPSAPAHGLVLEKVFYPEPL